MRVQGKLCLKDLIRMHGLEPGRDIAMILNPSKMRWKLICSRINSDRTAHNFG